MVAFLACASCDIFHSTDLPTKCSDGGCADSAPMDAGVSPFTTDSVKAFQYAQQVCAWLAACESPMGHNMTGTCLVDAVLAYDRTINPNRAPKGAARTFWQCAFDASTTGRATGPDAGNRCDAMYACVYPTSKTGEACGGMFVGCAGMDPSTRIDCRGSAPNIVAAAEPCKAQGKACSAQGGNSNALCTGPQGQTCMTTGCTGSAMSFCDDAGVDLGQDCSLVGGGTCTDVFDAGACKPEGPGSCVPTQNVTCDDAGVAHGCMTGVPETVDCKGLLGDCVEGLVPTYQPPSRACTRAIAACTMDKCSNGSINACMRGRLVMIDCGAVGLGPCTTIQTSTDGPQPACGKP